MSVWIMFGQQNYAETWLNQSSKIQLDNWKQTDMCRSALVVWPLFIRGSMLLLGINANIAVRVMVWVTLGKRPPLALDAPKPQASSSYITVLLCRRRLPCVFLSQVMMATKVDNKKRFQQPDKFRRGRICPLDRVREKRAELFKCISRFLKWKICSEGGSFYSQRIIRTEMKRCTSATQKRIPVRLQRCTVMVLDKRIIWDAEKKSGFIPT